MIGHEAEPAKPSGQVVHPHEILVPPDTAALSRRRPPTPVPQPPPPQRRPSPDTPTTTHARTRTDPLDATDRDAHTRTGRRELTSRKPRT
ncbi:hypothetical protein [Streptomyces sp. B1-3]|uniref:hypothetical protein n=1 Tax=Streptomyces sp. B1-3 TaxID=3141453 RepID=UPI003D2D0C2F